MNASKNSLTLQLKYCINHNLAGQADKELSLILQSCNVKNQTLIPIKIEC